MIAVQLAFPIIPILVSCIISYVILSSPIAHSVGSASTRTKKRNATITVLIITFVYCVFNIPVFVNFTLFTIITIGDYPYPGWFYDNSFMYFYSWNISYIMSVVMNSTTNPFIYFFRVRKFKHKIAASLKRRKCKIQKRVSSIVSTFEYSKRELPKVELTNIQESTVSSKNVYVLLRSKSREAALGFVNALQPNSPLKDISASNGSSVTTKKSSNTES